MKVVKGRFYLISNMVISPKKSGNILTEEIYCELFDYGLHSAGCLNIKLNSSKELEELFNEDSMYHEFVSNIK